MRKLLTLFICIKFITVAQCQDFEFPKGSVLNLEYFNGFTTQFHSSPELYLSELRLTPQYTVIPKLLRIGVSGGLLYNDKKFSGLFGPSLAFKIKTISIPKLNSSIINLQWIIENLWGTDKQQLIGTGFKAELGQILLVSLTGDRDFNLNYWRFQCGIGYNFIRKKVPNL